MKTYLVRRCGYHRKYFGHFHVIGMIINTVPDSFDLPRLRVTDGMCPACCEKLKEEIRNGKKGLFIYEPDEV